MSKILKSFYGINVSVVLRVIFNDNYDDCTFEIIIKRKNDLNRYDIKHHYYEYKQFAFQAFSEFVKPLLF